MDFSDFLDATLSVGNDLVKPRAAQQSDIMRNCLHLKTFENISTVRYHLFWYLNIHNMHFQKHNFGKNIGGKLAGLKIRYSMYGAETVLRTDFPPKPVGTKSAFFLFHNF